LQSSAENRDLALDDWQDGRQFVHGCVRRTFGERGARALDASWLDSFAQLDMQPDLAWALD
jgi:hypothetical protein